MNLIVFVILVIAATLFFFDGFIFMSVKRVTPLAVTEKKHEQFLNDRITD
ncbi:hypothetical protein L8S61_06770 [Enterobacter roggenkampii]|nr:hypothetical protein [Enterobacter asburiae]MCK6786730.1 hypothetical protein [Enterobacter roggenkampii]MCM7835580.1 hypothetical protein [Enterobacter asburiae]